jgi:hypothetical protein
LSHSQLVDVDGNKSEVFGITLEPAEVKGQLQVLPLGPIMQAIKLGGQEGLVRHWFLNRANQVILLELDKLLLKVLVRSDLLNKSLL